MTKRIGMCMLIIAVLMTPVGAVQFEVIERGDITIRYEEGMKSAALAILGSIPSLERQIEKRAGIRFNLPIEIVIFRNRSDFLITVRNEMVAAYAVPERNTIVIDLSQMKIHPLNLDAITMHEMTHLILHQNIKQENLPKWFDEGISEWVSGISEIINPNRKDVLKKAVISNKLIPFFRMSYGFPNDKNGFTLAYEQSRSMVEYIENQYTEDSIRRLLLRLKEGMAFNDAVRHEFRVTFADLERNWQKDVRLQYTWIGYVSNNIHWIVFVVCGLITVYGFLRLRKRIREYPEEEDDMYDM